MADEIKKLFQWEMKITASERRILISSLVGKATRKIMGEDYEAVNVGAFERTGCLMTIIPNKYHDSKIRLQGIKEGIFVVPKAQGKNHSENNL